jgi:molybdate transport system ATP-binding protein
VLPARIVSMKAIDSNEVVVVVALGADGAGARLLSRLARKSWEALSLAEGVSVYAQVKAVALAPGRGDLG